MGHSEPLTGSFALSGSQPLIGTVSLLENDDLSRIRELELDGLFRPPAPHVSFHVAAAYEWIAIVEALENVAVATPPLRVHINGAGVFDAEEGAVLYLGIDNDDRLAALHRTVFRAVDPYAHHSFEHYAPQLWQPHVTVAQRAPDAQARAIAARITNEVRGLEFSLTNLAFLSVDHGRYIVSNKRPLAG